MITASVQMQQASQQCTEGEVLNIKIIITA